MSLPSRERGLKFKDLNADRNSKNVAPFAGAWIEIHIIKKSYVFTEVAPFAGAWIEISLSKWNKLTENRRSLRGSVD